MSHQQQHGNNIISSPGSTKINNTGWMIKMLKKHARSSLYQSIVNKVYLELLWEPRFQYKGNTLRQFLDLLTDNFQATQEERAAVKALIEETWDPNQHIIKLFSKLKKHLTTLGETTNAIPYPDENFIEALYMAVQKTKQFTKVCEKWKQNPAAERATEAQARAYFKDAYEIYNAELDSQFMK